MRTRTRSPRRTGSGSMPGKTRLFHAHILKSSISATFGVYEPGWIRKALSRNTKSRSTRMKLGSFRVHDDEAHHAHRHLHHLVGVRVIHEVAGLRHRELVDERFPDRDVGLRETAHAIHAVRQQHAVPVDRRVLGQFVGDEDAQLVAFHAFDRRPGRLAVVAPEMRGHAGRHLDASRVRRSDEIPSTRCSCATAATSH